MNIPKKNISPETIEFYMQKSQQERSDAIFKALIMIKHSIAYFLKILTVQQTVFDKDKTNDNDCGYANHVK